MITRPQDGVASGPGNLQAQSPRAGNLLTVTGDSAKIEGKFQIADSLQIECEIGGELEVGGRLVIGQRGIVRANVRTVDALIMGTYEGNMVATGNVEIATSGRVLGNLQTDSLVIEKGGFFNGNVTKSDKKPAVEARKEVLSAVVGAFASDKKDSEDVNGVASLRARNEPGFFSPSAEPGETPAR
jgi:cytoskeletal protein CcmA (bactofilin family)